MGSRMAVQLSWCALALAFYSGREACRRFRGPTGDKARWVDQETAASDLRVQPYAPRDS